MSAHLTSQGVEFIFDIISSRRKCLLFIYQWHQLPLNAHCKNGFILFFGGAGGYIFIFLYCPFLQTFSLLGDCIVFKELPYCYLLPCKSVGFVCKNKPLRAYLYIQLCKFVLFFATDSFCNFCSHIEVFPIKVMACLSNAFWGFFCVCSNILYPQDGSKQNVRLAIIRRVLSTFQLRVLTLSFTPMRIALASTSGYKLVDIFLNL